MADGGEEERRQGLIKEPAPHQVMFRQGKVEGWRRGEKRSTKWQKSRKSRNWKQMLS